MTCRLTCYAAPTPARFDSNKQRMFPFYKRAKPARSSFWEAPAVLLVGM